MDDPRLGGWPSAASNIPETSWKPVLAALAADANPNPPGYVMGRFPPERGRLLEATCADPPVVSQLLRGQNHLGDAARAASWVIDLARCQPRLTREG